VLQLCARVAGARVPRRTRNGRTCIPAIQAAVVVVSGDDDSIAAAGADSG
jgi:hypothetical protein